MTPSTEPKPLEFLSRLSGDTGALVSGILSIPSTVLSIYVENKYVKTTFAVCAVLSFLIASYRLWLVNVETRWPYKTDSWKK